MVEKKNCHSCKYLEYECGDEYGTGAGWYCEKRDPTTVAAETKLLNDMQSEAYRNRYKRCFEIKPMRIVGVQPPLFSKDPTNIQY